MKKLITALLLAVFLCVPLCACKNSTKKASQEKNYAEYFPVAYFITSVKSANANTADVLGEKDAYESITLVADPEKTDNIFLNYIKFNFSANENIAIDFMATITTNNSQTIIPLITEIDNGKGTAKLIVDKTLVGETTIKLALTIPGGNGIDGLLYDHANAYNGFMWAIEKISIEAN